MVEVLSWADPLPLEKHRHLARQQLDALLAADRFHGRLPVLLLDRCWLRLELVALEDLSGRLPPDASAEAPELVRFRQLRSLGWDSAAAEQRCWNDFGRTDCRSALVRFWQAQDRGHHGWTLDRYLVFLRGYRERFEAGGERALPLIVLARPGSNYAHRLQWLRQATTPMRHTCA
jgi:hypothetical protein